MKRIQLGRCLWMLAALTFTTSLGCRVTDLPLWGPTESTHSDAHGVQKVKDVAYFTGPGADTIRHRADLYLPRGQAHFPVVVLVHGGAWMLGDNRCCGLYSSVGEFLASRGIGVVMPNYRLSPSVQHPEHIKDVARAFAWTKKNISHYGGDSNNLFVAGHSAGGHLVTLLATDDRFLQAEHASLADIRGVISISGVYRIPTGNADVFLGGSSPDSLRWDEMSPIRAVGQKPDSAAAETKGPPLSINLFAPAFGNDPKKRVDASPVAHVRPGLPPFLLISADKDLPLLPKMAEEMHNTLLKNGCRSRWMTVDGRNHNSIVFQAIDPTDPTARAILEFIAEHRFRGDFPR